LLADVEIYDRIGADRPSLTVAPAVE